MSADELTAEVAPGIAYRAFVEAASSCRTEAEFRASRFFRENGEALESVLSKPQIEAHPATRPSGRDDDRLRVVHWNIEKGKELPLIIRRLTTDPVLRAADLYCLNEVDVGMARSGGNAHVARVLAEALGCHSVFVPSYLECTKGPGAEAEAPGENRRGWHGLAILSRIPIESARVVALPHCFDYFDFFEKRFGRRQGLVARIRWQGAPLEVVTTHLEVRNTPACRARQMEALLQGIGAEEPVARVLTGDFNTNSFRRGSLARSIREFLRIVSTRPRALDAELAAPFRREPLFSLLSEHGFTVAGANDGQPTAEQVLGGAEDLDLLPAPVRHWLSRSFGLGTRVLRMRLDWIVVSRLDPQDARTHTAEVGASASDHALIHVDLERPGEPPAGPRL